MECFKSVNGQPYFIFLDAVQSLVSDSIRPEDVDALQSELSLALALMERDFPVDIQVSSYTVCTCMHACIRDVYVNVTVHDKTNHIALDINL